MNYKPKILVIDDELDMLRSTCKILNSSDYYTFPIDDARAVENHLISNDYDLILCDLLMPNIDGKQILEILKKHNSTIPVIIFSAYGTIDRAVSCMKAGAFDFIEKPFDADHLLLVVERALNFSTIFKERNELLEKLKDKNCFENMIGKSDAMIQIFSIIESISNTDVNVLITGESGTGKELIARCIHRKSKRRNYQFVPVNCAALPENLFEAEIFGYEKGAFTGAENRKIGLLENAAMGTFFLDEIGDLSQNSQTKLLRVLQERKLRRLGGNDLIDIDVRFISATNQDINKLKSNNKLRDDLYYRINVINIQVPPLRERIEDIQLLIEHFLSKKLEKSHKSLKGVDKEAVNILENYNWPGNVRELENVIERAVALSRGDTISVNDLPTHLYDNNKKQKSFKTTSLKEARIAAVEEVERQYLDYLMNKHKGNVSKVSEDSNMSRRNVYHILKKYNIDPESWRND